jgi:hypothetical protein
MKHDHWIFLAVIAGAIAIAWYHHTKELATNSANK